jgi:trans-2,3-dihydro-3-hydroxyanthranilate isomerase
VSHGRDYRFVQVDVFTNRVFGGNPLAVFLDGRGLSDVEMQSIANEMNLSETTFVFPPADAGHAAKVRIFTPSTELPFAGHPSVGAAWVMHDLGRVGAGRIVQECGAGLLPLDLAADGIALFGGDPTVGEPVDPEDYCAAVGLDVDAAIGTPVRWCGMGLEFAFLHVADDAVGRAAPDIARLAALGGAGVSVFGYDDGRAHARVFAVGAGVPEDPATGSAALGLGAFLVASGLAAADGSTPYVITQGVEMNRPSRLSCVVEAQAGLPVSGRVSGSVAPIAEGRISVPGR